MKKFVSIILASVFMATTNVTSIFAESVDSTLMALPLMNDEYKVTDSYIPNTITGIHQPYVKTSYDSDPIHSDVCYMWEGVNYKGTSYIDMCYLDGHTILLDGDEYALDINREYLNEFSEEFDTTMCAYSLMFTNHNDEGKSFKIYFKAPSTSINYGTLSIEFSIDGNIKLNTDTIEVLVDAPNDIAISLGFLRELGANIYWDGTNPYILDMPSVSPYMEGKTFTEEQLTNYILGNISNEGTPISEIDFDNDIDIFTMDVPEILDVLGKVQTILTDTEDDFYVGDLLEKELNDHEYLNTEEITKGLVSGINDILRDNNDDTSFEDLAWYTIKKAAYGAKETLKDYINAVSDEQFESDLSTVKMLVPFLCSAYSMDADTDSESLDSLTNEEIDVHNDNITLKDFSNNSIMELMTIESKEDLINFLENVYNKLLTLEDEIKVYVNTVRDEALSDTVSGTAEDDLTE